MRVENPSAGVVAYVIACCFHPSKEGLSDILDDNVVLSHITNGEKKYAANGKNDVLNMYEQHLFSITSDIVVKTLKIKDLSKENTASMKLIVEESKKNYAAVEGESRWKFVDETEFTFVKEKDGSLKIGEIFTKATSKELINSL